MAVDQELDQRLRSAIRNKQLLEFNYHGNDRVVEPHDYGIQNGIVRLLCWQVGGRSRTTFDEMVRMDLKYASYWTPWTDFKILLDTPRAVLSGEGAY